MKCQGFMAQSSRGYKNQSKTLGMQILQQEHETRNSQLLLSIEVGAKPNWLFCRLEDNWRKNLCSTRPLVYIQHSRMSSPELTCSMIYWIVTQLCTQPYFHISYHTIISPYSHHNCPNLIPSNETWFLLSTQHSAFNIFQSSLFLPSTLDTLVTLTPSIECLVPTKLITRACRIVVYRTWW